MGFNSKSNLLNPTDKINPKLHFRTQSRSDMLQCATFNKNTISINNINTRSRKCLDFKTPSHIFSVS